MSCSHVKEVSAWLDDELSPEAARWLELHLQTCVHCQEERASLERLSGLFESLRVSGSQRPFRLDAYPRPRPRARRIWGMVALLTLGVAALLGLAVDLQNDELQFEAYLDRSIDRDVYEVSSLVEDDLSRDMVVGLLISSTH